jgi:hypothetical protein
MKTVYEFLLNKGGITKPIVYKESAYTVILKKLNENSKDRFIVYMEVYSYEPNAIKIYKKKLSGDVYISEEEIDVNHNNLHTTLKENWNKLKEEMSKENIPFVYAEE